MKNTYLISTGIVDLLQNRYKLKLSDTGINNINTLELEFVNKLGEKLDDKYDFRIIPSKEIKTAMKNAYNSINGLPVILLDDVYFNDTKDFPVNGNIDITRLVDDVNDFNKKSLGPRNGGPSLEAQIKKLSQYKGKDIALMDIGIFEGETLFKEYCGIVSILKDNGINASRIYVSILNSASEDRLKNKIEIIAGTKYNFEGGDWLEVRDFLGLDGRKMNRNKYPVGDNTYIFARYIQDEKTLKDGASITDIKKSAEILNSCYAYKNKILDIVRDCGYNVTEGCLNNDKRLYTLKFEQK